MKDGLDPDDYDIAVGSVGPSAPVDEEYDPTSGVDISDEQFEALREHVRGQFDVVSTFLFWDLDHLGSNRYVCSYCRHTGGAGKWQDEYIAIAVWDSETQEWTLSEVERLVHESWH